MYSPVNEAYYPSSAIQSRLAVIDTCLAGLLDVNRAGKLFDNMRMDLLHPLPESLLNDKLYNRMLEAYFDMVGREPPERREAWLDRGWDLYEDMALGKLRVKPNATTFSIALSTLKRYPSECQKAGKEASEVLNDIIASKDYKGGSALETILTRDGQLEEPQALELVDFAATVAKEAGLLSLASTVEVVRTSLIKTMVDPLEGVPEAVPVTKPASAPRFGPRRAATVPESSDVAAESGTATDRVPYNIQHLRSGLQKFVDTRGEVVLEERQLAIETLTYENAKERWEKEFEKLKKIEGTTGVRHPDVRSWMWTWFTELRDRLKFVIEKAEMQLADNNGLFPSKSEFRLDAQDASSTLMPFLKCISAEKLAIITIMEIMSHQGAGGIESGIKTARALMEVGRAIEAEYQANLMAKYKINHLASSNRPGSTLSATGLQALIERRKDAKWLATKRKRDDHVLEWTVAIKCKVGAICVDELVDIAKVPRKKTVNGVVHTEIQPAFSLTFEFVRGFKIGVIRMNEGVSQKLVSEPVPQFTHSRQLPMISPPKPWVSEVSGAYLTGRSNVMRVKDCPEQQQYLKTASKEDKMEAIFQGLDVLSSTPWVINREIFDVVLKVWNSGKEAPGIPPSSTTVVEPTKPDDYDTNLKAKADHLQRIRAIISRKRNNHSERCSTNYKVEIARAFLGETFYLPHNVDFRGRAYPMPPHLSHVGDDLSRGLLKFSEKRALGNRGLRWLKIHLANVFGNDKINLDERETFTMDHIDDVYDSATNPLEGRQWWLKADDPWQCLATCKELYAALESPDPEAFLSNLPVHQDGTCNGLQHYAALGGDAVGAAQVNLDVTDKPSDVYTYVANMVEAEILRDIERGHSDAKYLSGKVSRKVVKQTVMTTVYGVTMVGARAQIERQLLDRGDVPSEVCWYCAQYLAQKTLACIGDLFKGANAIQSWLTTSARAIARSVPPERVESFLTTQQANQDTNATAEAKPTSTDVEADDPTAEIEQSNVAKPAVMEQPTKHQQMTSVIWTTVLGLPIVQPYRKVKKGQVATKLQSVLVSDPSKPSEVSPSKQASAFPPNFIHSLDATHMMLTAIEMRNAELTFASVHDSYWTHAASIDQMSTMIRDTFVWLHSQEILKGLLDEFKTRYEGYKVPINSLLKADIDRIIDQSEDLTIDQKVALYMLRSKLRAGGKTSSYKEAESDTSDIVARAASAMDKLGKGKGASKKKAATEDHANAEVSSEAVFGPFIDLKHVLPKLPKKGTFDVSRTKSSLYFFS